MRRIARPRSRAFKRAYARSASKRPTKKAKSFYQPVASISNNIVSSRVGFGDRKVAKFLYVEKDISITGVAAGAPGVYKFRANSLFDPNLSGVGHQALGFDQLIPFFETYCVTDCQYKVTFTSRETTNVNNVVAVSIADEDNPPVSITTVMENGACQWAILNSYSANNTVTLSGSIDIAKAMGTYRKNLVNDRVFKGTASSNPSDVLFLTLYSAAIGTGTGATVDMVVELTYTALMEGGKITPAS